MVVRGGSSRLERPFTETPDKTTLVLVELRRHLIGVIGDGLLDVGEGTGVVRKMFVSPASRGSGAAEALLDALVRRARDEGMTELLLGTTSAYLAAHRFYEKHGFVRVDPRLRRTR